MLEAAVTGVTDRFSPEDYKDAVQSLLASCKKALSRLRDGSKNNDDDLLLENAAVFAVDRLMSFADEHAGMLLAAVKATGRVADSNPYSLNAVAFIQSLVRDVLLGGFLESRDQDPAWARVGARLDADNAFMEKRIEEEFSEKRVRFDIQHAEMLAQSHARIGNATAPLTTAPAPKSPSSANKRRRRRVKGGSTFDEPFRALLRKHHGYEEGGKGSLASCASSEPMKVGDVAKVLKCSKATVTSLFKKHFGNKTNGFQGFKQYCVLCQAPSRLADMLERLSGEAVSWKHLPDQF